MKKALYTILVLISAFGVCISGYQIIKIQNEYSSAKNSYEQLQELMRDTKSAQSSEPESNQQNQFDTKGKNIDFNSLQSINPDVIGWLRFDGCKIDYPVVQGTDNNYYLKHLYDKTYNSSGCLFLDYRNSMTLSDRNSVIFGHHMKNGTMFSDLSRYKEQSFYDAHPTFTLYTPQTNYTVEVFAAYVADLQDDAWKLTFDDESDFSKWLDKRTEKSLIHCGTYPTSVDKILTLSTCSYEFENARFVLFGVLMEESS